MRIDCGTCRVRGVQCGDCVVSLLLGQPPGPVELQTDEQEALAALAGSGLLPPLRLVPPLRVAGRNESVDDVRLRRA